MVAPCPLLIRLAAPDHDKQPGFGFLDIGYVQGYQLRTVKCAREAQLPPIFTMDMEPSYSGAIMPRKQGGRR